MNLEEVMQDHLMEVAKAHLEVLTLNDFMQFSQMSLSISPEASFLAVITLQGTIFE